MSSLNNIFLWGDWFVRTVFSISMDLEKRNTKTPKEDLGQSGSLLLLHQIGIEGSLEWTDW